VTRLLLHEGKTFEDQTILVVGHAYVRCRFDRCTIVWEHPGPGLMDDCTFGICVWRLRLSINDIDDWKAVQEGMMKMIEKTLPGLDTDPGVTGDLFSTEPVKENAP
jgi:hypothetical protein